MSEPSDALVQASRVARKKVSRLLHAVGMTLMEKGADRMGNEDWRAGSRASRLAHVGWTHTFLWLHTAMTGKNMLAAGALVDSPVPTTSALALRAALESSTWFKWTLAGGDDETTHARALVQAAREMSFAAQSSHPEAFKESALSELGTEAESLGFEVVWGRTNDGRDVIQSIGGQRRHKLSTVLRSEFPDVEVTYGSLSALAHGEAWRVAGGSSIRVGDGETYRQIPDTLSSAATSEVLRVVLAVIDEAVVLTGRSTEGQPWRATLLERIGRMFPGFDPAVPTELRW